MCQTNRKNNMSFNLRNVLPAYLFISYSETASIDSASYMLHISSCKPFLENVTHQMEYVSELADVVAGVTYTKYHMSKHSYVNVGNNNVHNYVDNNNANNDNDYCDANLAMHPKR